MSADAVIATHRLTKRYGSLTAVDGLDLLVRQGDRYGFLGPNGSGKTTTVRMLLGLVFATSGTIELLGRPMPRQARSVLGQVGALVEAPAAYPHLSGRANLRLLDAAGPAGNDAAAVGAGSGSRRTRRRRVDDALERVGLGDVGRRPVRAYSMGMRQRLGLAAALVRTPRLLVLDEPTNGLDPRGIHDVRDLLLELNQAGTTVFLSSHLLPEVELFCTRVGVLHRGRLVAQDALGALRGPTGRTLIRVADAAAARSLFGDSLSGDSLSGDSLFGDSLSGDRASADGDGRLLLDGVSVAEATARLVREGIDVLEAVPERRTLEETVLGLTS